ncbi:MAG: DNA polymerase III subunit chi [Methylococcaceae bacterium]|nr:DNA polymerase III subunit chi [Methylococcaceae bacterium]
MTRIDFYILPSSDPHTRRVLGCKLAEKAWRQGMKVYIHTGSEVETAIMDKLLWTFRQGSFIPHALANADEQEREDVPVLIGQGEPPEDCRGLLINLSLDKPPRFEEYQRVAELVDEDETVRAEGRRRYAAYKQQGHELETHKLE